MDVQRYAFLVATLGEDGAQALAKAAERVPTLASVLIPRAILAWLQVQDDEFEGELPGLPNSYLSFSKTENNYTGTVSVQDTSYGFEAATPMHLAASIGIALGVDAEGIDPQLRDHDLQRLGKSVDLLCKARKAVRDVALRKDMSHEQVDRYLAQDRRDATPGINCTDCGHTIRKHGPGPSFDCQVPGCKCKGQSTTQKAEGEAQGAPRGAAASPGPAAAQRPPQEALAPIPPVAVQPRQPPAPGKKVGKPLQAPKTPSRVQAPSVKLTMSQTRQPCPVCALPQFKGERLVGCPCFAELAKNTTTERTTDGLTVTFGLDWEPEAMDVFLEGFRGKTAI